MIIGVKNKESKAISKEFAASVIGGFRVPENGGFMGMRKSTGYNNY